MVMKTLFLLLALVTSVDAFAPSTKLTYSPINVRTGLQVATGDAATDIEGARIAFFFWFFGASGGAGIARSSFPRMYNNVRTIQGLKGVGPTLGGEKLRLNPICGYPEDLYRADVEKILNNKLSVEQIVEKYPVEGNFLSSKGYLTYQAFKDANEGANPLAVRAIFDTLSTSTDVCNPDVAQEKLDSYSENLDLINRELIKAKLLGFSSIFTLLFLLGLADVIAFGHARDGWFPDWPGLTDLPGSLFDPNIGLTAIPKYWLSDSS